MQIGFALIPDEKTNDQLIKIINENYEKNNCIHELSTTINLPHITLFQSDMIDNIEYKKIVRRLAKQFKNFIPNLELEFNNIQYVNGGWYFWMCEPIKGIMSFQHIVMERCQPYLIDKYYTKTSGLTSDQKGSERRFGYAYGGYAYEPHITLTRTKEENDTLLEILKEQLPTQSIKIEKMVAFTHSNDNLLENIIAEANISKTEE